MGARSGQAYPLYKGNDILSLGLDVIQIVHMVLEEADAAVCSLGWASILYRCQPEKHVQAVP